MKQRQSILNVSARFRRVFASVFLLFLVASLQPVVYADDGVANSMSYYAGQLKAIPEAPTAEDATWRRVPNEKLQETLQFLVEQQNANYKRIQSWSGTYQRAVGAPISPRPQEIKAFMPIPEEKEPRSYVQKDEYYAFCDLNANKTYGKSEKQEEIVYNSSSNEIIQPESGSVGSSNLEFITTSKENVVFYHDANYAPPPPLDSPTSKAVKMCQIQSPNSLYTGVHSSCFDPRSFFLDSVEPPVKRWNILEQYLLPTLMGKEGEEKKAELIKELELYEKETDGDKWYWLNYGLTGSANFKYAFNRSSGFNIVYKVTVLNGKPEDSINLEYVKVNDVYIPSSLLLRHKTRFQQTDSVDEFNSFRYLKLVDAQINPEIPKEQFTLAALELNDEVLIQNTIDETYYHYRDGKLVPFVKFGSSELIVPTEPVWRSPTRLIALGLGVFLVVLAVVFKTRRKRSEAS